jgi:hypothetical protein
MRVTMVAGLCCVPVVVTIAMVRSLVRRPVQNKGVRHQCTTDKVHAAMTEGHVSRPWTAATAETEGVQVPTLTLSAAVAWLRRHFRHSVAAHAVLPSQTAPHSSHDRCCCNVGAPC